MNEVASRSEAFEVVCPLISSQQTNCRYRLVATLLPFIAPTASHVLKTIYHNYIRQLLSKLFSIRTNL